jgi:hypothetical protein
MRARRSSWVVRAKSSPATSGSPAASVVSAPCLITGSLVAAIVSADKVRARAYSSLSEEGAPFPARLRVACHHLASRRQGDNLAATETGTSLFRTLVCDEGF